MAPAAGTVTVFSASVTAGSTVVSPYRSSTRTSRVSLTARLPVLAHATFVSAVPDWGYAIVRG